MEKPELDAGPGDVDGNDSSDSVEFVNGHGMEGYGEEKDGAVSDLQHIAEMIDNYGPQSVRSSMKLESEAEISINDRNIAAKSEESLENVRRQVGDDDDDEKSTSSSSGSDTSDDEIVTNLSAKLRAMEEQAEEEDGGLTSSSMAAPRTQNEVSEEVEAVIHKVLPSDEIAVAGCISSVIPSDDGANIIIKSSAGSNTDVKTLNEGSLLCLENRIPLGTVFEIFGPISNPFYLVKWSSQPVEMVQGEIHTSVIGDFHVGAQVYCVTKSSEYVTPGSMLQMRAKGSDASNIYDEELPLDQQEFSDDELEALRKRETKGQRCSSSGSRAGSRSGTNAKFRQYNPQARQAQQIKPQQSLPQYLPPPQPTENGPFQQGFISPIFMPQLQQPMMMYPSQANFATQDYVSAHMQQSMHTQYQNTIFQQQLLQQQQQIHQYTPNTIYNSYQPSGVLPGMMNYNPPSTQQQQQDYQRYQYHSSQPR